MNCTLLSKMLLFLTYQYTRHRCHERNLREVQEPGADFYVYVPKTFGPVDGYNQLLETPKWIAAGPEVWSWSRNNPSTTGKVVFIQVKCTKYTDTPNIIHWPYPLRNSQWQQFYTWYDWPLPVTFKSGVGGHMCKWFYWSKYNQVYKRPQNYLWDPPTTK